MKLASVKKSDYINSRFPNPGKPILSVNGKSGIVALNKYAVATFKLKPGEYVGFLKDQEQDPPDWYFKAVQKESEDAFILHKGSGRLQFSCKPLVREIIGDLLKKLNPHKDSSEFDLDVLARFFLATKSPMDGDSEVPDIYAMMGGKIIK